jgi:hypothetical protein
MQSIVNNGQWAKADRKADRYRQLYTSGATFSTIFETLVELKDKFPLLKRSDKKIITPSAPLQQLQQTFRQ